MLGLLGRCFRNLGVGFGGRARFGWESGSGSGVSNRMEDGGLRGSLSNYEYYSFEVLSGSANPNRAFTSMAVPSVTIMIVKREEQQR